jgi:hypothetical protein
MKRMLDTNICSHVLRRHPPGMLERFSCLEQATRHEQRPRVSARAGAGGGGVVTVRAQGLTVRAVNAAMTAFRTSGPKSSGRC